MCAELELSAVKDTEEAAVEVGPSIHREGAAILKVGLLRSKYGKGGGDALGLLGEGEDKGVWKIAKGKSKGRRSIRLSSGESLFSSTERGLVQRRFSSCSRSLASRSKVKVVGLKCCKGVRLYDDSPEPASGLSCWSV